MLINRYFVTIVVLLTVASSVGNEIAASPEVDALIAALASENSRVAARAVEQLGELGPMAWPAIPALEQSNADRALVLRALQAIGPGRVPFPYTITQKEIPSDRTDFFKRSHSLHVEETGQKFYMGSTYQSGPPDFPGYSIGFNEDTVVLRWLAPNQLLHIRWQTIGQVSGGHRAQGNLLLHREDTLWNEVFRDWRHADSKSNNTNYTKTLLTFEWDSSTRELLLRETIKFERGGNDDSLGPLSWPWNARAENKYFTQRLLFVSEWQATLKNGTLLFDVGTQYLGLLFANEEIGRAFPPMEFATFLNNSEVARANPNSVAEWERYIRGLNPDHSFDQILAERLVIGQMIPPFRSNPEEMFRTPPH